MEPSCCKVAFTNREIAMVTGLNYTEEEVSVLVGYIQESVAKEGTWGTSLSHIQNIKYFLTVIKVKPWVKKVLEIPFTRLPCCLNSDEIRFISEDNFIASTSFILAWVKPLIVWRPQIGK